MRRPKRVVPLVTGLLLVTAVEPRAYPTSRVRGTVAFGVVASPLPAPEPIATAAAPNAAPPLTAATILSRVYGRVRGKEAVAYANVADAREGLWGTAIEQSVSVRRTRVVRIAGRTFWRTASAELIDAAFIQRFHPSAFAGVVLGVEDAPELPFGWAQSAFDRDRPVVVRGGPERSATEIRRMAPRTIVRVLETSADGRAVRIAEAEWVDVRDVHVARPAEPPASLAGAASTRWIRVDLAQQVLVAYEGTRAVYATLVSTGKQGHSTPAGVFRIQSKAVEAAMRSDADDRETYRVEAVPFVMAFLGDFALHGVYWHDGFGERRSHGCVNLAPRDAEWVFGFVESSAPEPPAGYGSASLPGSVVRIRRR